MPLTLVEYSYVCSIAMKVNLLYLSPRVRALWQHRTPSLISSNLRTGWSEPSGPCLQRGIAIGHLILSRAVETTTAFDYERPVQCQCIYALCMLIKWQHSYFLLLFLDRTLYHIQSNMLILLILMRERTAIGTHISPIPTNINSRASDVSIRKYIQQYPEYDDVRPRINLGESWERYVFDALAPPKFPLPIWRAIPIPRLYWPARLLLNLRGITKGEDSGNATHDATTTGNPA